MNHINLSPEAVIVQALTAIFGKVVFRDRLPIENSYVTALPHAIVVRKYSETSHNYGCEGRQHDVILHVTIFDRGSCNKGDNLPAGQLEAMDFLISDCLEKYENKQTPDGIFIQRLERIGSERLLFPEEQLIRHRISFRMIYI